MDNSTQLHIVLSIDSMLSLLHYHIAPAAFWQCDSDVTAMETSPYLPLAHPLQTNGSPSDFFPPVLYLPVGHGLQWLT